MKTQLKLSVIALAVIGLTACGKKEDTKAADANAITVTIAHAGPMTGGSAHLGKDDDNGVELALEHANAQNLVIGGKKVTFVKKTVDDQEDPKVATTVAQLLVDAGVAAVIGHMNSGTSIPASEVYAKNGIPLITGSATSPTFTERNLKTVFRTVGRDDQQGPILATYIIDELKAKSVALIDDKTAYGEGLANEIEKKLKSANVNVVNHERTTNIEKDFKSVLTKIKAKNPDVIFHGGMDATGGPVVKQARELGIKSIVTFGDGACNVQMIKLASTSSEDVICSQPGIPREATSKEFITSFNTKYGEIQQYAPYYYDATLAVIEAMKKADSVDPAKFGPELFNISFTGSTGLVSFDAKGDRKDVDITIFQVKDGKLVPKVVYRKGVATPFVAPTEAASASAAATPAAAGA